MRWRAACGGVAGLPEWAVGAGRCEPAGQVHGAKLASGRARCLSQQHGKTLQLCAAVHRTFSAQEPHTCQMPSTQ